MVTSGLFLAALATLTQVPPPDAGSKRTEALHREHRGILDDEARKLAALSGKLAAEGKSEPAIHVMRRIPKAPSPDGPTKFVPRPDVVPPREASKSKEDDAWRRDLEAILVEAAKALVALARSAAKAEPTPRYALADHCLREALDRDPDNADARMLLGYRPHKGGWATPYAIREMNAGQVEHPVYGWVKSSWLPHLDKGELPAPRTAASSEESWLPAEKADARRREWPNRWKIFTEHFQIEANVPLAEAIVFGRRLEHLNDLFHALLADVVGETLPLAQRFTRGKADEDEGIAPHLVYYFGSRKDFIAHLRTNPRVGEGAGKILGIYLPPEPGDAPAKQVESRRAPAYTFRDPGGELDVQATINHEVSHQLLFESGSAGMSDYRNNVGNYWVFEGMGTYFETLVYRNDGALEIGGFVGARLEVARETLAVERKLVPLASFVGYDRKRFNSGKADWATNYQQAAAFSSFLMQAQGGTYREAFLDYFHDAYHGRLGRGDRPSLESRLDRSYRELEAEFLAYLKGAKPD